MSRTRHDRQHRRSSSRDDPPEGDPRTNAQRLSQHIAQPQRGRQLCISRQMGSMGSLLIAIVQASPRCFGLAVPSVFGDGCFLGPQDVGQVPNTSVTFTNMTDTHPSSASKPSTLERGSPPTTAPSSPRSNTTTPSPNSSNDPATHV